MTVHETVADGKLGNEELGQFTRKVDEIKRRLNEGTITLSWALNELQRIIEGRQSVSDLVIDFDATPMIPSGLEIRESDQIASRFKGKWTFNAKALALYLSKKQKQGKLIKGHDLKDDLDGEKVMGAQLLDFYLKNPHLIPDEWKGKATFFWGTIYRGSFGDLCVRYLYWSGKAWDSDYNWLDNNFNDTNPALLANLFISPLAFC
ncbi:MAG: hypothetical protein HY225_02235 [Candidatus Vogelbacteria bacterium]|nr:hypothetical protein [Candidatus Vogelbacteria bacterium]